jgi:magnesium and cobalt exporter, CNNM family
MSGSDWFELAIVVLLILVVGVLGAAEVSITRTNRVRAYRFQEEGRRGAGSLVKIAENPAPYLNVVLLLVLLLQIGGTTIATSLAVRVFHNAGELVATIVMTVLLFVFAEVTPKTFAIQQTDRVALFLAPLIVGLGRIVGPVATGLVKVANLIMPGKGLPQGPFITEHELRALAEVASDEDQIEEGEKELIHSIFEFGDTIVREVMLPRPDIVAIEADKSLRDVQALVLQHGYSRIPVFNEDLDDVAGIVYAKDVLKALHQGKQDMPLADVAREVHFVPESKKVADLLREMQKEKFHIALVTDEYGSVVGLVTLEDLLEELVGEITDEYDTEEPELEQVADDVFRVDGKLSIDEVNEVLDVELPDEEWDTVGGLMLGLMGSIPEEGEEVSYQNLRFAAEKVNGRRISKVLITREEAPQEPADGQTREEEARTE